jgi:hypothetical protein
LPEEASAHLPSRVYATELRLKGESGDGESALAELVAALGTGLRSSSASAPRA